MSIEHFIADHTPFRTTAELVDAGISPLQLTAATRAGTLVRVRRGHYAPPGTSPALVSAVRVGGLLSCVSALRSYGIWVSDEPFIHVWMRRNASRMRSPRDRWRPLTDDTRDGIELHWWPLNSQPQPGSGRVALVDALAQTVRCQPRSFAVAALDSALNTGLMDLPSVEQLLSRLPDRHRGILVDIDGRSMSGIETILRLALRRAGFDCDVQVHVSGVGRVDLVVEGCVVVEADGRDYHDTGKARERDYERDLELTIAGYTVLRFSYRQVMFQLPSVLEAIRVALANRASRDRPLMLGEMR